VAGASLAARYFHELMIAALVDYGFGEFLRQKFSQG
jgi:hypothetical protein